MQKKPKTLSGVIKRFQENLSFTDEPWIHVKLRMVDKDRQKLLDFMERYFKVFAKNFAPVTKIYWRRYPKIIKNKDGEFEVMFRFSTEKPVSTPVRVAVARNNEREWPRCSDLPEVEDGK